MYDVNKYVSVDVIEVNVDNFSRSSVAEEPDDERLDWNIDKHAFQTLQLQNKNQYFIFHYRMCGS